MSNLNVVQTAKGSKDRSYNRHFKQEIYNRYARICGCEVRSALFFFPCLLFGSKDSWSRGGIGLKDVGHLNQYAKKKKTFR
jgi:hypothetical protein